MQGFNQGRYVPPEHEGVRSGNSLHNRRAAGVPRRDGTQTVRFEMPFAVWCSTCAAKAEGANSHSSRNGGGEQKQDKAPAIGSSGVGLIPQGVRFNATKARVGKYYSTPIWSFTIKHATCGGLLEIRTDPKNTRYLVFSGGKARDYGDENDSKDGTEEGGEGRVGGGEGGILTPEERERRKEDAFAALEGKVADKLNGLDRETRVKELYATKERDWRDPWSANRRVREGFRRERKIHAREAEKVEELQRRIGTEMEILPEREEDARRAKLISFGVDERQGESGIGGEKMSAAGTSASGAAFFKSTKASATTPSSRMLNKKGVAESRKDVLRRQLLQNTRAVMNPFG